MEFEDFVSHEMLKCLPFVETFKEAAESVFGKKMEYIGRAGGLDARFSQYFDMAAACTGPTAMNIHGIDEYVDIPSVIQVAKILAVTIMKWCGYWE